MHVVDICSVKNRLRESCKLARLDMPPDRKAEFDRQITLNVLKLEQYRQCSLLLTYVSVGIETDTRGLIRQALADGKKVAVPRCTGPADMDFFLIEGTDDLVCGRYRVPEPAAHCKPVENFEKSLCIVPALCYDLYGYRLGYGKGYYDRFLSKYDSAAIGIIYSGCVRKKLPHGRFDRRVEIIVTQDYIRCTYDSPQK